MTIEQSEGGSTTGSILAELDHDCPYIDHMENLLAKAGTDLKAWTTNAFARTQIAALHADGTCPPTHPGGDMTKPGSEWSDHLVYFPTADRIL